MDTMQHTIKKMVSFAGIGLHSGKPVRLEIYPGEINSGLRLVRTDLGQLEPTPAFMDRVVDTRLATTLSTEADTNARWNCGAAPSSLSPVPLSESRGHADLYDHGEHGVRPDASVSTVEHVLAALAGLGIDNAVLAVDGPEMPIMDGSSAPFVHVLQRVGRRRQQASRWLLRFNREISYSDGQGRQIRIEPHPGFQINCRIAYDHDRIGNQSIEIDITPRRFREEIAGARTFGFFHEVETLRRNGLALGGSLDNAVVINEQGVMNSGGLRYADEFVRHKVLDLVGDLALLGFPMLGRVVAEKSGHGQHLGLMQAVAAQPEAWDIVALEEGGEYRVLRDLACGTRKVGGKVGDRILPYLLPPSLALSC